MKADRKVWADCPESRGIPAVLSSNFQREFSATISDGSKAPSGAVGLKPKLAQRWKIARYQQKKLPSFQTNPALPTTHFFGDR